MKTDRELLEQALEALWEANTILVCSNDAYEDSDIREKNTTIRQAITARLAEDDDEPAAWMWKFLDSETSLIPENTYCARTISELDPKERQKYWTPVEPLFRRPQLKARLTDEEIRLIVQSLVSDVTVAESVMFRDVARAIERRINGGGE